MRIFGNNKFYIKNTHIIEKLSGITSIVMDKTGTITETGNTIVKFNGDKLTEYEIKLVMSLVRNSSHPLSNSILNSFRSKDVFDSKNYKEIPGQGISAEITGESIPYAT